MSLPDYAFEGEEESMARRRLGHTTADEDEQRRFADSLLAGVDGTAYLGYPAIYVRWYYNYHCTDGGYCDDDFIALLNCIVDGCEDELAKENDCLGNQCYDEVVTCFDQEQCGYEYTDAFLYYTACQGDNRTAEAGSVCAANLTAHGEFTTYVQYNCWQESGCTDEYKAVFSCMEECAVSYLDVEDDYCLDCDTDLMNCFWDETCWNALANTLMILTVNDTENVNIWLTDNVIEADSNTYDRDWYTDMINDLVCENDDYDVECNDLYYTLIDCVYDRCVLPSIPCQVSGCANELVDCAGSDQCTKEFNRWANDTANDQLDFRRRRMQNIGDIIDDAFEVSVIIPTFTDEASRQAWLNDVYADSCDGECSAEFVAVMECFTQDCSAYDPDDGDDDGDGSDGGDSDGDGDGDGSDSDGDDSDGDSSDAMAFSMIAGMISVVGALLR